MRPKHNFKKKHLHPPMSTNINISIVRVGARRADLRGPSLARRARRRPSVPTALYWGPEGARPRCSLLAAYPVSSRAPGTAGPGRTPHLPCRFAPFLARRQDQLVTDCSAACPPRRVDVRGPSLGGAGGRDLRSPPTPSLLGPV
jgi:hypothetical protein